MATRGYILIESPEKDSDDPYIGREDVLVEAYHDGYLYTMAMDILLAPFLIRQMNRDGYGARYMVHLEKRNALKQNPLLMHDLGNTYDFTWVSLLDVLCFTRPFMYAPIRKGVTRYGKAINKRCADIVVETMEWVGATYRIKMTLKDRYDLDKNGEDWQNIWEDARRMPFYSALAEDLYYPLQPGQETDPELGSPRLRTGAAPHCLEKMGIVRSTKPYEIEYDVTGALAFAYTFPKDQPERP